MKRSDIKNAYNMMNPTREQKDRMLASILEENGGRGKNTGKYQAKAAAGSKWSWSPAAAAVVLVVLAGLVVIGSPSGEVPVFSSDETEPVSSDYDLMELDQFRAGQEWYDYLQENGDTAADDGSYIVYPYSVWGCENQEMAAKLDALCQTYSLTFRDQEERMTDSLEFLFEEVGVENLLKKSAGQETGNCAYWDDGEFYFASTVKLEADAGWIYPIRYVFHRTYPNVFLYEFVEVAAAGISDCWKYTNADGTELVLAIGEEAAFIYVNVNENAFYVEVQNPRVGDVQSGEQKISREAMEAFAETFDFSLKQAEAAPEITETVDEEAELGLYYGILQKYVAAVEEKWNPSQCMDAEITILVANYVETPEQFGYALMDLDRDGNQELIITDGNVLLDVYQRNDFGIQRIVTGWERNVYYLCDGLLIFNRGSNGAASTTYNLYYVSNDGLGQHWSIVYDGLAEDPWTYQESGNDPYVITEEEANELLESYALLTIPFTPITEYP